MDLTLSIGLALGLVAAVACLVLALPVGVFCLQVAAGVLAGPARPPDRTAPRLGAAPRMAVLVPAHNEAGGIAATLALLRRELQPGDRVLVVADNCDDDTAAIARAAGAEVAERRDLARRGKGYALDHGLRQLAADAPDIVVVVDADCAVQPGALALIARRAHAEQAPVQATYLMQAPAGSRLSMRIAAFAMIVKNQVRPLGFSRLGLPCQLMGTGMAFPWALLQRVSLATGHIVEDMQLGTELALAGAAPRFEPAARVDSEFPLSDAGASSQRTRWEHGHLQVLTQQAPRLLARGLRRRDLPSVALAADLLVPPLALLVMAVTALLGVSVTAAALGGSSVPMLVSAAMLAALAVAVVAAWSRHGRAAVAFGELLQAPAYALGKLPVYLRYLVARQSEWVRTRRRGE